MIKGALVKFFTPFRVALSSTRLPFVTCSGQKKKVNDPGVANKFLPVIVRQFYTRGFGTLSKKSPAPPIHTHFNREKIFCISQAVNFLLLTTVGALTSSKIPSNEAYLAML